VYAPSAVHLVIASALSVCLIGESLVRADEPQRGPNSDTQPTDFYKLVKHFDFDEQPLGNYEETPMHWIRLAGPGLPTYARGRFDHEVGHEAPPSFQLRLIGGNVGYEYQQRDLTVIPGSDYRVDAYVQTEGLRQARAFLEVYLVDRYGETIPRSNRVSELIRSDPSEATAWQLLRVDVPGDYPTAYALRPRLWILQSYVWCSPSELEVDPIVRRDIHARAWFDDISPSVPHGTGRCPLGAEPLRGGRRGRDGRPARRRAIPRNAVRPISSASDGLAAYPGARAGPVPGQLAHPGRQSLAHGADDALCRSG